MGFDKEQYNMVSEALQERANLVEIAPHLAYALPIMLPVYSYWQIPYYWVGIKVRRTMADPNRAPTGCRARNDRAVRNSNAAPDHLGRHYVPPVSGHRHDRRGIRP